MASSDDPLGLVTWSGRLATPLIPARAATIRELESLSEREDQVDANSLGEVVASDPLMTLRLMAQVARLRGPRQQGEPQTVTAALVWLGIGPFFRSIQQAMSVEEKLEGFPAALRHVERQMTFNHRAARLTLAFAAERGEPDAAVLHHAALLNDFHELLFWVHEPQAALQVESVQEADRSISPSDAQRHVLGIELGELKPPISRLLGLPRLLQPINSAARAAHPSSRCVEFALRIARRESLDKAEDGLLGTKTADFEALMAWLDISEHRVLALLAEAGG